MNKFYRPGRKTVRWEGIQPLEAKATFIKGFHLNRTNVALLDFPPKVDLLVLRRDADQVELGLKIDAPSVDDPRPRNFIEAGSGKTSPKK